MKTNQPKILVIEDDKDIAELVEYNLKQEKFKTEVAYSGSRGLDKIKNTNPDLILLDLMLPDIGGLEICRKLKTQEKTKSIPVIMMTAKSEEIDRIVGFEMGADDYICKPFSPRELTLRVKALIRRNTEPASVMPQELKFGKLVLDAEKFLVTYGGEAIKLTAIEFRLLQYLMVHKGRVATRDSLLDQVWGYDSAVTTRTVDTHIKRLRQKLGTAGDYIETLVGVGYRFLEKL
ncbi:MAG: DNA-binding response regulator [Deltaproteobacteria bacterium RIFCSPLOWO2_12_FULL_40_28]|nr:MAG: DNA-binding response regulator [Deltaproteobacteria bacterium RIFCSPHIGHO2_02_FULL_40_28]OGQ20991.1 MAG: DNA-binding response regulator [Deltaproteobacteria bacterium RIFCSPHIGHO2_12_FULL_40_32]OGQ39392.1 MAG: DNA-binding response regulator [Deltaproteobacteria bacterium RIFCSPLOWO2_02_FULL_40_36]OGQ54673.1 MAG: DNA-binding response regulator [Deltaproteobacteria bacterium RIFCSPLOWO2_12_FULL_40_28]